MRTKKIFLADEAQSIREGLSKTLGVEGYEVVLAEDGQQAIHTHGAFLQPNCSRTSRSLRKTPPTKFDAGGLGLLTGGFPPGTCQ